MVAATTGLLAGKVLEGVIHATRGGLVGRLARDNGCQHDAIAGGIEDNVGMCIMTGLTVHPQMGCVGRAFAVNGMTGATLGACIGLVGRTSDICVALYTSHMLMGVALERRFGHCQGNRLFPGSSKTALKFAVAADAEHAGCGHAFIGMDVLLPVAIQADQRF